MSGKSKILTGFLASNMIVCFGQDILLDRFTTAYTGIDQNQELNRQTGTGAPVSFADIGAEWQSPLDGTNLAIYASGNTEGVRTEIAFTGSSAMTYSVDSAPGGVLPLALFVIGAAPADIEYLGPTGFGVSITLLGELGVFSQGTNILMTTVPVVVKLGNRLALLYDAPVGDSISHMRRDIGLAWLDLPLTPPAPAPRKS